MFHALKTIMETLCVGFAVAVVPYLLEPGPWWRRLSLGVVVAAFTRGTLWDRDPPTCTRKD